MLSRRGQLLSRLPPRPSFAGRGLVEQMRSTAFALLGVTAAMALGLVALASHQSWPYFPVGPIPTYEAKVGKVDEAVALAISPARRDTTAPSFSAGRSMTPGAGAAESKDSGLSTTRQASSAPPTPGPTGGYPGGESTTTPSPSPPSQDPGPSPPPSPSPSPSPAPAPAPTSPPPAAPSQPVVLPPATSSSPGKGHAYGKQKATAPKEKPPRSLPTPATPPVAETAPSPAPPGLPVVEADSSDGPGNGHGHAYGHDK
jgi:hypothetical protein